MYDEYWKLKVHELKRKVGEVSTYINFGQEDLAREQLEEVRVLYTELKEREGKTTLDKIGESIMKYLKLLESK